MAYKPSSLTHRVPRTFKTKVPKYVEPIGLLDIEKRVIRACKTIRALPDRERRFFSTQQGIWINYIRDSSSYNVAEFEKPKFRPTPADVSDVLTALSWCRALDKEEFEYIWRRSFDISFGVIGRFTGTSDETARVRYKDAILKAWHAANFALGEVDGRMELRKTG